jgi:hypothetical protein
MKKDDIENHSFTKTMMCVDCASTFSKSSDYTAIVVGSKSKSGLKFIRESELLKVSFEQYCDRVIELLEEYPEITHLYIEKNTYQGADVVRIKDIINSKRWLQKRNITIINEMQRKNKDLKISAIVDDVNSGSIIFRDDTLEFNKQLMDFTGQIYSLHDDAPDIIAEFTKRIDEIDTVRKVFTIDRDKLGI